MMTAIIPKIYDALSDDEIHAAKPSNYEHFLDEAESMATAVTASSAAASTEASIEEGVYHGMFETSGKKAIYSIERRHGSLFFVQGMEEGELFNAGEWLIATTMKNGETCGYIRLKRESDAIVSNYKKYVQEAWANVCVATQLPEMQDLTLTFRGPIGVEWHNSGYITEVNQGQAKNLGVQVGWIAKYIDGKVFSLNAAERTRESGAPYEVTFKRPKAPPKFCLANLAGKPLNDELGVVGGETVQDIQELVARTRGVSALQVKLMRDQDVLVDKHELPTGTITVVLMEAPTFALNEFVSVTADFTSKNTEPLAMKRGMVGRVQQIADNGDVYLDCSDCYPALPIIGIEDCGNLEKEDVSSVIILKESGAVHGTVGMTGRILRDDGDAYTVRFSDGREHCYMHAEVAKDPVNLGDVVERGGRQGKVVQSVHPVPSLKQVKWKNGPLKGKKEWENASVLTPLTW